MNTTEIVIREVQGNRSFQVRQLFAEGIREPRKTAHRHSHGEVLPLYKAGRNLIGIGIALAHLGYNPLDWRWGVPPFGAFLPVIPEHLRKLGKVYIRSKAHGNALRVVVKPVSRDLRPAFDPVVQVPQERRGFGANATAHIKRGDELGFRVNRHIDPLAAELGSIALPNVAGFLLDKRPDFVELQIPGPEISHSSVHRSGAALSRHHEKAHDCVAIDPGKPLGAANRATFDKALDRPGRRIGIRYKRVPCQFGVGFAEGGIAGSTAPTLNAALTEVSKPFADLVLTFDAGHGFSPLDFCGEKPQNLLGFRSWLTPRFGLSPDSCFSRSRGAHLATSVYGGLTVIGRLLSCHPASTGWFAFAAKSSAPTLFFFERANAFAEGAFGEGILHFGNRIVSHIERAGGDSRRTRFDLKVSSVSQPLQRGSYRSERIGLVAPEFESRTSQAIPDARNGKPLARMHGKNCLNRILYASAFRFDIINCLLIYFLLILRQHCEHRKDRLFHLGEFHFGLIALTYQDRAAVHEVAKNLPIIDRLFSIHNGGYYETNVYTCQDKS